MTAISVNEIIDLIVSKAFNDVLNKIHKLLTLSFGIKNIQDTVDNQYGPFIGRTVYFELGSKLGGH